MLVAAGRSAAAGAGQRENLRVRRTGRCCSPAAASTNTRPGSEEEAYTGTHRGAPDTAEALAHKSAFSADGTYCPSNEFKWKYNFVWSSLSVPGGRAGLGCHAWGAGGQLAVTTGQCRHSTLGAGPSQGRTKVSGVTRPRPAHCHAPAASDPAQSVIIIITSLLSIRSVVSLYQHTAATELGATDNELKAKHVS